MKAWHPARQAGRRRAFYAKYLELMGPCVDARGQWTGKETNFRERVWHCFALLGGDAGGAEAANAVLRGLEPRPCHFTPVSFLQLLALHDDRLAPEVRESMKAYVRLALPLAASPAIHPTMYNDNFAALACHTLVVGGEMLGDAPALEAGRAKLRAFADLFRRRGTVMEYGSPTYTPVNTHVFASLAALARDPECRALAAGCEHRMWAEIAAHWHGPSGHLAGPYSRAYWVDSVGHPHLLSALLWLVFGEAIFVNPMADLMPPHDGQVIHIGLERLMLPNMAWLACQDCRCPDRLARLLLAKRFPSEVSCTSESLPSRISGFRTWKDGRRERYDNPREYPGFAGPNTAFLDRDFSLAAGFSGYHDGALTETFYATYRRCRPARCLADTGVVLARFIFNDHRPEQKNYYSVYDSVHGPDGFRDEARAWGLQKRGCGLYAYRPKPFEGHEVSSMRLCVLFPSHFAWPDEAWLADEPVRLRDGPVGKLAESRDPCPVFVRCGPVFFAFRPLALTDLGRSAAVRVERWDTYLAISFFHCEGPARAFGDEELLRASSGFVAHVGAEAGDAGESGAGFADFRARAALGTLNDETTVSEDGWTRWIRYRHPDADLAFAISPASEGILYATVDGRPRPEPVFEATGIDARRLPFLGR